jgi:hypothetical protein
MLQYGCQQNYSYGDPLPRGPVAAEISETWLLPTARFFIFSAAIQS